MRYRNVNNGIVIDIPSKLTSPDWVEVSETEGKPPKEVKKRERGKKLRKPE